ncbi:MAG: hypothetical protein IJH64_00505 [Oscillospiraceae bacterium]|nr:hypothetical protein [Oscillospiraceae bacterium]
MPFLPSRYHRIKDEAYDETEEILAEIIAEIESVYGQAYEELYEKAQEYLAWFVSEDEAKREEWLGGTLSEQEYKNWRQNKLLTGRHWYAMTETITNNLANKNSIAYSIINDYIPEVYAINGNWATYQIEKQTQINTSFELFDEQTIERLIREKPDLLPKASVNIPLDVRWNKQNLVSAVMQSIIQGESVDGLASRLAAVSDMNQSSAIRNAKTIVTSAQNGGRQASYERAETLGIKGEKVWLATLDFHTRSSHRKLDGSRIGIHEKFANGLMFPGDPAGAPAEVYNCRCRVIEVFKDQDFSKFERNSRLGAMSYDEWKESHGGEPQFKAARNVNRDYDMMREYKTLLGKKVPTNIRDFQDLKYNHPSDWKKMVSDARKARNRRRNNGKS